MEKFSIGVASDHAGFDYKQIIKEHLEKKGYNVKDYGCYNKERADYPDYVHPLAKAVSHHEHNYGIMVCGSGNGVNMTANKYAKIRAALCWNEEIAELARQHNDANVMTMPARFVSIETALNMVDKFLSTDFEGGRHLERIKKIPIE